MLAKNADEFLAQVRQTFGSCTTVYETCTDAEVKADFERLGAKEALAMYKAWDRRESEAYENALNAGYFSDGTTQDIF